MKALIILIIILVAAIWLGLQMHHESGQVLIHYGAWSIETTVWVALFAIILAFVVMYCLIRLIQQTQLWPRRMLMWGRKRKRERMLELTRNGLTELIEREWHKGEQHLDKAASLSPLPFVNYFGAAYAACQQGAYQRSEQYVQKIQQKNLVSALNARLLQMQLYMAHNQWDLVELELPQLYQQHPKNPQVAYLLAKLHVHHHNWLALSPLLATLQRQHLLPANELQSIIVQNCRAELQKAVQQQDLEAVLKAWRQAPPAQQMELLPEYVQHLLTLKQDQQAVILIERFLKQHWNVDLLTSYAKATSKDLYKQLSQAEFWLSKHPNCPELYTCLGILCMRCQLWGKAKEFFSAAINLRPQATNYFALGQVNEALNEQDAALQQYRQGLSLLVNS